MSSDRGQATVELALGLPIFLLAAFFAFALLDQVTTDAALAAALERATIVVSGTNSDEQARGGAKATRWLRGQDVHVTFVPPDGEQRCAGTAIAITLSAPGHLSFLIPGDPTRVRHGSATVEGEGVWRGACASR